MGKIPSTNFHQRNLQRGTIAVVLGLGLMLIVLLNLIAVAEVRGQEPPALSPATDRPYLVLLGITQDAGFPQAGCEKDCCRSAWSDAAKHRYACSMAIVDPRSRQRFMIECTPDHRAITDSAGSATTKRAK